MSDETLNVTELAVTDIVRVDNLCGRIQQAIDTGPLPSIQVAVALKGELVLFETFGAADNSTRYNVFSCTKPLVAS
ncbi:MAG: serine hydrolase, partial [Halioglobus sp.]|nr:serine hydrolase [Halioglobus sp.]